VDKQDRFWDMKCQQHVPDIVLSMLLVVGRAVA